MNKNKRMVFEPRQVINPDTSAVLGSVELIDIMGDDDFIAQCARTSFDNKKEHSEEQNARLVQYLYRNKHTTPIEMVEVAFKITAPIFVIRQWIRHRTASTNEVSRRYVDTPPELYLPEEYRSRPDKSVKQGSGDAHPDSQYFKEKVEELQDQALQLYDEMIEKGVAPEMARFHLPVSCMTSWVWKIDLHNLLHFLELRRDSHAQKEIKAFADMILDLLHSQERLKAVLKVHEDMTRINSIVRQIANDHKDDLEGVARTLDVLREGFANLKK